MKIKRMPKSSNVEDAPQRVNREGQWDKEFGRDDRRAIGMAYQDAVKGKTDRLRKASLDSVLEELRKRYK